MNVYWVKYAVILFFFYFPCDFDSTLDNSTLRRRGLFGLVAVEDLVCCGLPCLSSAAGRAQWQGLVERRGSLQAAKSREGREESERERPFRVRGQCTAYSPVSSPNSTLRCWTPKWVKLHKQWRVPGIQSPSKSLVRLGERWGENVELNSNSG